MGLCGNLPNFNRFSNSGLHAFTSKSRNLLAAQYQVARKNIMFLQLCPQSLTSTFLETPMKLQQNFIETPLKSP